MVAVLRLEEGVQVADFGSGERREDDTVVQTALGASGADAADNRVERGGDRTQEHKAAGRLGVSQAWDLGGVDPADLEHVLSWDGRSLNLTQAVIFMIDSTDRKTETLSMGELYNLLMDEHLSKAVFLVFANKQDLPEAMSEAEIISKLKLGEIKKHAWHIQKCSALQGEGIEEGLDWLYSKLTEKQKK